MSKAQNDRQLQLDVSTIASMAKANKWDELKRLGAAACERLPAPSSQPSQATPIQLPFWPEPERAAPTALLRSALFGVVKKGPRAALEDVQLASWPGCELRYTGLRLDQYDEDVWMQVLHLARRQDLSDTNGVRFTVRGFLREMGTGHGQHARKALTRSLKRLSATSLSVGMERFEYTGSLIDDFAEDKTSGCYVVRLNPRLRTLFDTGHTRMQAQVRRRLPTDLARWLYGYVRSHKATAQRPHRIGLARLRGLTGSETELKDFRRKLRASMDALKAAGIVAAWKITSNDALEIVRPRGHGVGDSATRELIRLATRTADHC